jgi:CubicO group peptidase (beta-lactamase class C family)
MNKSNLETSKHTKTSKMKNKLSTILYSTFWTYIILGIISCKQTNNREYTTVENTGVIYPKPNDIASNISIDSILSIGEFLSRPENKVKIQFPGSATKYAWQHMSKFLPTGQVLRSDKIINLPYAIDSKIGGIAYKDVNNESITVNSHFEKFPIDAMIVIKNGKIVYERYKTMMPEDKHIWFSVSKVIGSTLLLGLEKDRKIDINKFVTYYLPELSGTVWDSVRVIETLNMATGLNGTEHDEPNNDSRINPKQIWFQWASSVGLLPQPENADFVWYEVIGKMKRIKPAFTSFEYNSINTFVINRIVERVANKPLTDLFSEQIWSKLGMEHDGYMIVSPTGLSLGFFGMNSTLRDMAKFGMLFTPSSSNLSDEEILTAEMIEKIQKGTYPEMFTKGHVGKKLQQSFPIEKGLTNNYQWDAVFTDGDIFKAGVGGQGLYISPSKDIVVAWFCTGTGNNREETMARTIVNYLQ